MVEDRPLVPYAPDFTPASMGNVIGQDHVLRWLLEQVQSTPGKHELTETIANQCFGHILEPKNRSDMASHVVQALVNYGLMTATTGTVAPTDVAIRTLAAPPSEADRIFARHILANCNGLRLVELIKSYELRGETPGLEDLARELDRSRTSKSISTMKVWLARAGVMKPGAGYSVDYTALDLLLGPDTARLFGRCAGPSDCQRIFHCRNFRYRRIKHPPCCCEGRWQRQASTRSRLGFRRNIQEHKV